MEAVNRKSFQGITNIIRFNWHFYVLAIVVTILLLFSKRFVSSSVSLLISVSALLAILSIAISLAVSFYVYDLSNLYKLDWLGLLPASLSSEIVNINAGFDETSFLFSKKYPRAHITVFDFYNPQKHTEVSIKRARKAYSAYPGTKTIRTSAVPLTPDSVDNIFCVLSAHEIRDSKERCQFFNQLKGALKNEGRLVVVEHLRDVPNFIAYNIGFFHFHSGREWKHTFESAKLSIEKQVKITPFITVYILQKNGTTS